MSEESQKNAQFEQTFLPHLDAAYNLARWIMNNDQDAEDMVQEAYLRAYKYFVGFHGGSSRVWLLKIVRNTCYTWLHQNRAQMLSLELDDDSLPGEAADLNPEALVQQGSDAQLIRRALEEVPVEYRELLILRELEEMSYKEIALVADVPIGTVMSRLARARQRLKQCLVRLMEEGRHEL